MIYVKTRYCIYAIVIPISYINRPYLGDTLLYSIITYPKKIGAN